MAKQLDVTCHLVKNAAGETQMLMVIGGRAYYFTMQNAAEMGQKIVRTCATWQRAQY